MVMCYFVMHADIVEMRIYLNIFRVLSFGDADHPKEFVDVVTRVTNNTSEDDQDVIHIQGRHDLVGFALVRRHGLSHLLHVQTINK